MCPTADSAALLSLCRPPRFEVPVEAGRAAGAAMTGNFSRAGVTSTLNASNMSSAMVGWPRTPSTFNLPRTPTVISGGAGGATSNAGIAAGLARASSRQVPPLGQSNAGLFVWVVLSHLMPVHAALNRSFEMCSQPICSGGVLTQVLLLPLDALRVIQRAGTSWFTLGLMHIM